MLEINFAPFPELETPHLHLVRLGPAHREALFQLRTMDEVMRYIGRPRPKDMEELDTFMNYVNETIDKNEGITWAICKKDTGEFVGNIGYYRFKTAHYRGEIGYAMLPQFWGKGIMSEAMQAALDFGFNG